MAMLYKTGGETLFVGDEGNFCYLNVTADEHMAIIEAILKGDPCWRDGQWMDDSEETGEEYAERKGYLAMSESQLQRDLDRIKERLGLS